KNDKGIVCETAKFNNLSKNSLKFIALVLDFIQVVDQVMMVQQVLFMEALLTYKIIIRIFGDLKANVRRCPPNMGSEKRATGPNEFSPNNFPRYRSDLHSFIDNQGFLYLYGGAAYLISNTMWKIAFAYECFGKSLCNNHTFEEICSGKRKCIDKDLCSCTFLKVSQEMNVN